MSDIGTSVRNMLVDDSSIGAVVSARVMPGVLHQNETLPAITYQVIDTIHAGYEGAKSGLARARVQVKCFDTKYATTVSLSEDVRVSFDRYAGTVESVEIRRAFIDATRDDYEPAVDGSARGRYVRILDFFVWYVENTS